MDAHYRERNADLLRLYHSSEWREYSRKYLREHPFCECGEPSEAVDHKIPVSRGGSFWNPSNHQQKCHRCHNRKTATTDGGFGR
jgi:5-methylcytosine-specific restriction protein A